MSFYTIGDAGGIPVCVSSFGEGPVWLCSADDADCLINSSLEQFLQTLLVIERCTRPIDPPHAVESVRSELLAIDGVALLDSNSYWSIVLEEWEHGF